MPIMTNYQHSCKNRSIENKNVHTNPSSRKHRDEMKQNNNKPQIQTNSSPIPKTSNNVPERVQDPSRRRVATAAVMCCCSSSSKVHHPADRSPHASTTTPTRRKYCTCRTAPTVPRSPLFFVSSTAVFFIAVGLPAARTSC